MAASRNLAATSSRETSKPRPKEPPRRPEVFVAFPPNRDGNKSRRSGDLGSPAGRPFMFEELRNGGLGGTAFIRISHGRYCKTAERLNRQRHGKRRVKSGSDETRTRNPAT